MDVYEFYMWLCLRYEFIFSVYYPNDNKMINDAIYNCNDLKALLMGLFTLGEDERVKKYLSKCLKDLKSS